MVLQNIFTARHRVLEPDLGGRLRLAGRRRELATGFATPQQVVTAWMASPGHCRNILDPQYASVGTDGVSSLPVLSAASGPATWTQDFGLTMTQNDPSHNWGPAEHPLPVQLMHQFPTCLQNPCTIQPGALAGVR